MAGGGGFFAGGMAQGFGEQTQQQNLATYRTDELKLQQQGQQNAEKRFQITQTDKALTDAWGVLDEYVGHAKIAGHDTNDITKHAAGMLSQIEKLEVSAGRSQPGMASARFATLLAKPSEAVTTKALSEAKNPMQGQLQQAQIDQSRSTTELNKSRAKYMEGAGTQIGEAEIDAIGQYKQLPPSTAGSGPRTMQAHETMRKVYEKYPDFNPQQSRAIGNAMSSGARVAANREANLGVILETVETAVPGAIAASAQVPRGNWVPVNKLVQMVDANISDPALKVFKQRNLQLAELWAKSMNPTGAMRNEDRSLALDILGTADGAPAYKAVVQSIVSSIGMEKEGAIKFLKSRGLGSVIPAGAEKTDKDQSGGKTDPLGIR